MESVVQWCDKSTTGGCGAELHVGNDYGRAQTERGGVEGKVKRYIHQHNNFNIRFYFFSNIQNLQKRWLDAQCNLTSLALTAGFSSSFLCRFAQFNKPRPQSEWMRANFKVKLNLRNDKSGKEEIGI